MLVWAKVIALMGLEALLPLQRLEMHFEPIVYSILVFASVAALGLALGNIKIRGIGLGVAGVLFAGILIAQFSPAVDSTVLGFAREFGLILFVYMTGLHVGRGFLSALRKQGWTLNLLTIAITIAGAGITALAVVMGKIDIAAAAGIFAGASTNTPSLGAAQEALKSLLPANAPQLQLPGLGYAVSYPFAVFGIIFCILVIRIFFRIDARTEAESYDKQQTEGEPTLNRLNVTITNANLEGLRIAEIPGLNSLDVVVSRIKPAQNNTVLLAHPNVILHKGDVLLGVGSASGLEQFRLIVGEISPLDLTELHGPLTFRRVVVTRKSAVGQTIGQLNFPNIYGVNVTRVARADIELTPRSDLRLEFGDMLQIVGEEPSIARAAEALGNSLKDLGHTNLIPIFLGIVVGVLLGTTPIPLPGLPSPVRLGLAGGPLLVAIIMSQVRIGPIISYVAPSASTALRELGIVLFLAAVGLKAGDQFVDTIVYGDGLQWIGWGIAVTMVPLIMAGVFARIFLKMNFVSIAGLMAGSMTDPPALAFANTMAKSDSPAIAYAAVYPVTMLLRILTAQILVVIFCR
jgi:putative transport protein